MNPQVTQLSQQSVTLVINFLCSFGWKEMCTPLNSALVGCLKEADHTCLDLNVAPLPTVVNTSSLHLSGFVASKFHPFQELR